jgi:hypothetical protein
MQGKDDGPLDTTVSIKIPESAEVGDELTFQVEGREFSITIPPATQPGDILQIKLGRTTLKKDEAEETAGSIRLVTGNTIFIASDLPDSTAKYGSYGDKDSASSDGTYLCLWPASRFVIEFMNTKEFQKMIAHDASMVRSVLELGAGHGLFGMAFADIVSSLSSFADGTIQVALTDLQDAMDQLQRNVEKNLDMFEGRAQFKAIPLAWHDTPIVTTGTSIDFILGSDLLYNCSKIPELVATVKRLLSKSTRILLSVRWRKPIEERAFFVALSEVVEWKMLFGRCPLDFRAYGNPACEASNQWFTQTMVGCGGKTFALSSIDEAAQSRMTDAEFDEYERLQTQIYLGTTSIVPKTKCISDSHNPNKRHKI